MDNFTLILTAVGLAMDAFSVAVTDGIILKKIKITYALKIGMFFGVFQFGMLFIGTLLGSTFSTYISDFAEWFAFFLLMIIGGKMLYDAIKGEDEEQIDEEKNPLGFKTLVILAIATSIDALAVGVSLAAMNVDIMFSALVVGLVAFLFSFCGVYIGGKFGNLFGSKSEIAGGLVLIGIGIKILIEHLFF